MEIDTVKLGNGLKMAKENIFGMKVEQVFSRKAISALTKKKCIFT